MEIFKLFGSIFVDNEKANQSISATDKGAQGLAGSLGKGIGVAAKWGAAFLAAGAAIGGVMMAAAGRIAETTDVIDKSSRRAGTSAENWQKLNYAFGQSGISSEALEKTMVKNQKALNEAALGSGKAAKAYEAMGVSIKNADGSLRDADDVYSDTLNSLADIEDMNKRNALANDIFGKSYSQLAPILDEGSKGIEALTSRAEQLGIVLSQETVDAGVVFGDTLDDVKQVGAALFNMIAAEVLPVLQKFLDFLIASAPKVQEALSVVAEFVGEGLAQIAAFWEENSAKITEIATYLWETLSVIVQAGMDILKGIIDIVMGLISGDWEQVWTGFKSVMEGAFELMNAALRLAIDFLVSILKGAAALFFSAGKALFQSIWDGMKSIWDKIASWVTEKIEWIKEKLAFFKKAQAQMSGSGAAGGGSGGSFANGLAYVPFDGYMAQLHKGERVLTADEAKEADSGVSEKSKSTVMNLTVNVKSPMEVIREIQIMNKMLVMKP